MLQREIADPLERNSVSIFSILEHLQPNFCCNLITFLNIGGIRWPLFANACYVMLYSENNNLFGTDPREGVIIDHD